MGYVYHVSHTDLDGVGCHVVGRWAYGDSHVPIRADYNEVDYVIGDVVGQLEEDDALVITDLSVRDEDTIDLLASLPVGHVLLIDHHKTSLPLAERFSWAHIDTSKSGTALLYEYLVDNGHTDEDSAHQEEFVRLVNDYDLWIHEDPRSKRLNTLLHGLGWYDFFIRFSGDPDVEETVGEKLLVDALNRIQEEYVKRAIETAVFRQDEYRRQYARVYAEQHQSALGNAILEHFPDVEYVQMINMQAKTVSLRSRPGGVDVSFIASQNGGGGHPTAAGYTFKDWT